MANVLTSQPIKLDTTGATSAITTPINITAIAVKPSAASWEVVLNVSDGGSRVYSNFGADKRGDFIVFPKAILVTGLYYQTGTNVEEVLVYKS